MSSFVEYGDGAIAFLLYAGGRLTDLQAEVGASRGRPPTEAPGVVPSRRTMISVRMGIPSAGM
jgi:hypothetical protein